MVKRLFDMLAASVGLLAAAPLLLAAALAIRLLTRGPVFYRAPRTGQFGRPFTMYKLRTMGLDFAEIRSRITGVGDPRVFPLGRLLRRTKIDELPQLLNVLRGDMSLVGPRPEVPEFVVTYYGPSHWETLAVRPGLASPGTLYQETHGDGLLDGRDPEACYLERLLPTKLALDLVYVRSRSFRYDLAVIGRTVRVLAAKLGGRTRFPDPVEMADAARLLAPLRAEPTPAAAAQPVRTTSPRSLQWREA